MSQAILDGLAPDLEALEFVEWDRFTVGDWDGQTYVTVYGWIDREDDYKDFVIILRWADGTTYYTTSSAERTEEIHRILWPDDPIEEHNDCQRVEEYIDIPNAIRLVADGGSEEIACGYCGATDLAYELESDRGPLRRCIRCLAVEQGGNALTSPFEEFIKNDKWQDSPIWDTREEWDDHRRHFYEAARDWYRILGRIIQDDPIIKRDPDDFGTVKESIRTFLTNIMGADAHYPPSEIVDGDRKAEQTTFACGDEL